MLELMRDFVMNRTWAFAAIVVMIISGITTMIVQTSQRPQLTVAGEINACIAQAEFHFPSNTLRVEDHTAISQACANAILKSQN